MQHTAIRSDVLDRLKQLISIGAELPIHELSLIYDEYGVDAIAAAAKQLDKSQRDKLRRLVNKRNKSLDEEAIGDFAIGQIVRINSRCNYQSLHGQDLTIVEIRAPWLVCQRPRSLDRCQGDPTFAPGLLKEDLTAIKIEELPTTEIDTNATEKNARTKAEAAN